MTPMPGIGREHALEPLRSRVGAVGDDDHARVDRVADADAAAVVDADPRRARGDVDERVEDRPVRDRVGAVAHRLGLPVRRRDGARVEVIAADHDGRLHRARPHELVDREPRLRAVAVAEPADPRGQPLECHPLGRELEPLLEERIVREQLPERRRRSSRCRPGPRTALPSETARCRDRTAAGYRPGRSPGMRRPPLRHLHGPPLEGCCHNRKHTRRVGRTRASPRRGARSTPGRAGGTRPDRTRAARPPRPPTVPAARSRSADRAPRSGR